MTQPSSELDRLLELARTHHDPSSEDEQRVLASLRSAMAASAMPPAASQPERLPAHPGGSAFGGTAVRLWGKMALGAAALSTVGALVWPRAEPPAASRQAPAFAVDKDEVANVGAPPLLAEPPATHPQVTRDSGAEHHPAARVRAVRAGASATRVKTRTNHSVAAEAPVVPTPSTTSSRDGVPEDLTVPLERPTYQQELALVRKAQLALRDEDAASALRALQRHADQYPQGLLHEERAALTVVALCALGRNDEGRAQQLAFLKNSPSSPMAQRVRAACSARRGEP